MRAVEAVDASPYHIAYAPSLRLRLGPFQRSDGRIFTSELGTPDEATSKAIRYYSHLDPWTWKKHLTAEMLLADWFPGLPTGDPVKLLAWLAEG